MRSILAVAVKKLSVRRLARVILGLLVAVACVLLNQATGQDTGRPATRSATSLRPTDSQPTSQAPTSQPATQPSTAPQPAAGQPAAQQPESAEPATLGELIRQAREEFTPPSEKQLADARVAVTKEMAALERFVQPSSSNGRAWLKYLHWDAFKKSMTGAAPPDRAALADTYRLLNRNEPGLELPSFRRLSPALRQYLDLLAVAGMEDPAAVYKRQLDTLEADLGRYRSRPTAPLDYDIGRRLDFLAGVGAAPKLVEAIHKEFGAPNAFVNASADYIIAAANHSIDRTESITDNILGTSISGTGHTTGKVEARVVPSENSARIEIHSKGHVESNNTGRNGPAVIQSSGHADFSAAKLIELSDKAFRTPSANVNAIYDTDIHSIGKSGGGFGSRLVSSQGWSRARQQEGQVESIAADHTEERVARRMDEEVDKKVRDARKRYEDEYRRPLARHGDLPERIQFGSTADELKFLTTQVNRSQLAAPAAPPELPAGNDLSLRLHSTAVNNYSASVLGGATASETEPGQDRAKFDVELPKWMKDAWSKKRTNEPNAAAADEPFKPTTITFRQGRPLSVDFDDNKVKLTIHVARLISGEDDFANWDISGTFTPQLDGGGVVLTRDGDLEVFPTEFNRESGDQLNPRQVAVRSNLTKVLNERSAKGRGFPTRIEFGELKPGGSFEKVGPLEARLVKSDDGWLTLAWNRK